MVCLRHLASALTNTEDEAEDLAVHRQAFIYGSGSLLSISYLGFKAVQSYRVLIQGSKQSNRAELSIVMDQSCLPMIYLGLKVNYRVLNRSRTIPEVITVRFGCPA